MKSADSHSVSVAVSRLAKQQEVETSNILSKLLQEHGLPAEIISLVPRSLSIHEDELLDPSQRVKIQFSKRDRRY